MNEHEEIIKNLRRCPHFEKCSQNLCPLDLGLHLRSGKEHDKCRWMREPKKKRVGKREFVSGGSVMPDAILKFVPESNLKRLNRVSQERWKELKKLSEK